MNVRDDRTLTAVLAVTLVSLLVRVVGLGSRVAHWDEARVAYWILEYGETGVLFYRPAIHGPLLKLVNAPLFGLFGASDFLMRLFPALVGGLLPLVALAFRHRLREETVVALALLLALNPVLLYYSRFMRGDILAGGFSFLAFACLVRAIDFDDGRYLFAGTTALALGFGAKENVLAYLVAFVGAAGLLLHHRLLFAGRADETAASAFSRTMGWAFGGVARHLRAIAGSIGVFLLVVTAIYVPRGSLPPQRTYYSSCTDYEPIFSTEMAPTLGDAIGNPLLVPRLFAFTLGSTGELYACQWINPRAEDPNPYLEFLGEMTLITLQSSTALAVLAVAGFLAALYSAGLPDDLVSFSFYWGAASLVGYPFMADIGGAAWLVVHIVLPLSIPAAYAAGILYRWGQSAGVSDDAVSLGIVVLLAVVLVGSMTWTGYATSFADPKSEENPLVQFAQPAGDVEPTLEEMRTLADQNDGTDVVLYGEHFNNPSGDDVLERRPTCSDWFNALPLPWYLEAGEVDTDCAPDEAALEAALADDPPVVVAWHEQRAAVDNRTDDGYDVRVFEMRSYDNEFVFYVDEDRLE